jgi:hypothetical protein
VAISETELSWAALSSASVALAALDAAGTGRGSDTRQPLLPPTPPAFTGAGKLGELSRPEAVDLTGDVAPADEATTDGAAVGAFETAAGIELGGGDRNWFCGRARRCRGVGRNGLGGRKYWPGASGNLPGGPGNPSGTPG